MASLEKYKEQAKKFEQKEQWSKAIELLVKAIEEFEKSPEDDTELPLYTRAADAYQKSGDTTNAIAYYERAADRYADAGLVNQSIALCNKVQRLSPGRASIFLKLGVLFAKKGFAAEAKQNLLEYAGRMQKAGQIEEAFKALKKFAEMTPGQDDVWRVLAQQARAQATTPEAKEQVEQLLGEFEAREKSATQRKSRMSRSMVTGELIPEETGPKKGELIFLDVDDVPPRRSAGTPAVAAPPPPPPPPPPAPPKAKPAPPPPPVELPPLEIESTSLAPAAELPMLEIEPTSLGIEPTSLVVEPTSLASEPPALELEPTAFAEPAPEALAPAELEPIDFGAIELGPVSVEEAPAEPEAEAMAGLPLLEVEEEPVFAEEPALDGEFVPVVAEEELTLEGLPELEAEAPVAEAEVAQSMEFLDLGEVQAEAPASAELEARIAANAEDWEAHRLLGEALLAQGDRERGLGELEASLDGYDQADDLDSAYAVAEEILLLEPNSVRHQQKRVEFAYRQGDRGRLVASYLELADALLRSNDADKSLAVYQRVLEHDPDNLRAQSAIDTLAPPTPPEPVVAAGRAVPAAAPAGAGDYVDLGAFLFEEDAAPKDTRMRIQDEEPSGDEQKDFQDMLAAFKKGIAENVGEEDFQSHYDLGVAYKEMGLLDEAIAEFQKALRATEGRLKSSEALGMCFFEKGQFAIAQTIMRRGLDYPAHSDAERIGLLYWSGRAAEEQGKREDALDAYNRVFAVDINFADVQARVTTLHQAGA